MRAALPVLALILLAGCQQEGATDAQEQGASGEARGISRVTEEGPVKVTVTLAPEEPVLGDPLSLILSVEAQAGVTVEMPAFGEALGRFAILDFTPRRRTGTDGTVIESQQYTLQAPMSGRQRIPPLRIEYFDQRPDRPDGTAGDYRELLSEELTVQIASVLPEGQVADGLRPPRAALPELQAGFWPRFWPWVLTGVVALAGLAWAMVAWQRRAAERLRITAYDTAMRRLAELERQGLPEGTEVDAWYVELSDIVRRYIEDQYGVRAPELTTEEFLQEAWRSAELSGTHRELLPDFLEQCDRVKFAAYSPGQDESRQALSSARRFLGERPVEPEPQLRAAV